MKIEQVNQGYPQESQIKNLLTVANTAEKISKITDGILIKCQTPGMVHKMAKDWWTRNLVRLSPVNLKAEIAKLLDRMKS